MKWSVARSLSSRVAQTTEYEFRHISLPRSTSRGAARRLLTEQAEHGHWELARLRLHPDGTRNIVLRRKILRVRATL